jgi:hypothetical protein
MNRQFLQLKRNLQLHYKLLHYDRVFLFSYSVVILKSFWNHIPFKNYKDKFLETLI